MNIMPRVGYNEVISDNSEELGSMLDDNLDGIMTKLKAALPDVPEKDFRFITFLTLGFDTKTIARMTTKTRLFSRN